ncbi:MAG: hypothetical protein JKY03_06345, partial [Aureispira sp.]|nr:hypothetical protein [Aureispira sp.]
MNQKKIFTLSFLLFVLSLSLIFPNKTQGQSGPPKIDTVKVLDVEKETFVVNGIILNTIVKHTPSAMFSQLDSTIKDRIFTVDELNTTFDGLGLAPDSIKKIFLGIEEELEARRRLLVITQITEAIVAIETTIKIKRTEKKSAETG